MPISRDGDFYTFRCLIGKSNHEAFLQSLQGSAHGVTISPSVDTKRPTFKLSFDNSAITNRPSSIGAANSKSYFSNAAATLILNHETETRVKPSRRISTLVMLGTQQGGQGSSLVLPDISIAYEKDPDSQSTKSRFTIAKSVPRENAVECITFDPEESPVASSFETDGRRYTVYKWTVRPGEFSEVKRAMLPFSAEPSDRDQLSELCASMLDENARWKLEEITARAPSHEPVSNSLPSSSLITSPPPLTYHQFFDDQETRKNDRHLPAAPLFEPPDWPEFAANSAAPSSTSASIQSVGPGHKRRHSESEQAQSSKCTKVTND